MLTKCTRTVCLSALLLVLCFSHAAFAQTAEPTARKIDDFGDALPTDVAARLDNFAVTLQNEPGARGFIIGYRSHRDLPGVTGRHINWMRNYLIHSRGFDAGRITAIDGGTASCLSHEFWLVPAGAAPKPRDDAYSRELADTDVARKYDEYHYTIAEDGLESYSSEFENGLEGFADALRKEPRARAYIIAYEGFRTESWDEEDERGRKKVHRRVVIDPRGTAWKELRGKRAELVKRYGIPSTRVRMVNGGHRKWRGVELWVVPTGARPPVATPNVYPPRRGSR